MPLSCHDATSLSLAGLRFVRWLLSPATWRAGAEQNGHRARAGQSESESIARYS